MDFLISIPSGNKVTDLHLGFNEEKKIPAQDDFINLWVHDPLNRFIVEKNGSSTLIVVGDFIAGNSSMKRMCEDFNMGTILQQSDGFYYLIYFNHRRGELQIGNSIFSILPVYYYEAEKSIYISSQLALIQKQAGVRFQINKQYILERTLFNYALTDVTYLDGVKTLPANSYLKYQNTLQIIKHTHIDEYFTNQAAPYRKRLSHLAELFSENLKNYVPADKFYLSLTAGFDGRTLLSVVRQTRPGQFVTYSFGTKNSEDILIPLQQSERLNFSYCPFYLDDNYIQSHSYQKGTKLIEITAGEASFSRAHYLYAMEKIAAKARYVLTGNFGSEIFRAMHNIGVMMSQALHDYVVKTDDQLYKAWRNSETLKILNMPNLEKEFDTLFDSLLVRKKQFLSSGMAANAFFYVLVFEEVFRKYFGPELVMERQYLNNRTPFLSFAFIKELLKTTLAGVHSDFFENNPLKRFKGQQFYAYVICNYDRQLSKLKTAKGYAPRDLVFPVRYPNILLGYLQKKKLHKPANADSFAVKAAFLFNQEKYRQWAVCQELYNRDFIQQIFSKAPGVEYPLDHFVSALSANYYISHLKKHG